MSDIAVKPSSSRRINYRIIIFAAVIALLVGYPMYIFLDSELTHGVRDAGGGSTNVDLKQLSTFAFNQDDGRLEDIPQRWRDLNGKSVILIGEIAPTGFRSRNVDEFDLCYSVAKCCFSGPPQVQHFVESKMKAGAQ